MVTFHSVVNHINQQNCHSSLLKVKGKGRVLIQRSLHGRTTTVRFTISEMAVDWQEPVVLRCYAVYPLPVLMDIGPVVAIKSSAATQRNKDKLLQFMVTVAVLRQKLACTKVQH